ncbi:hypothetical protein LPMP_271890 [Leishmania panamensis]|uniref:Golgi apparatus membrane protein TVP23 homolog n=3 Tax=Leishmania guyanensis species complex TaxID=38579 RepID=A0A088RU66_LEIPA|nr:hypothetical protein LPMP_271890 [Leishmania panamensis]AIN99568.1 hypothetical protein LPMP_271890 [Leishmania panamensis]CCM16746.1 hypothetical protein, conserved [Leishmania guyanensis]
MHQDNKQTFYFSSEPAGAQGGTGFVGESNQNYTTTPPAGQDGQTIPADTTDHGGYKGAHPIVAFFHVCFKVAAILVFLLSGIFGLKYVLVLVITILLLTADFWTTKNVTGRILVSMRWWNEVKEDGSTQWIFESSHEADQRVNAYDNWFFWITTGANCVVWVVLLFLNFLSFKYLPITLAGLLLSGANFLGYFKCRRDAQQKVTSFMLSQAVARPQAAGHVASFFMGGGGGNNTNATQS